MSELDDKLPIGAEQVAEATAILQKYKAGKAALDKRIVDITVQSAPSNPRPRHFPF